MRLGPKERYAAVRSKETERQAKLEILGEAAIAWWETSGSLPWDDHSTTLDLFQAAQNYALVSKRSQK